MGRGLSALMSDIDSAPEKTQTPSGKPLTAPIEKIRANPSQPRQDFDEADLESLTASIAEKGVIQPIIVRPAPDGSDGYQIIAGERRWRAAQRAQLHEMPIIIREMTDQEVIEVAIIENVQRADLNPVEEALGYQMLMHNFGHTQEQVSDVLGKSRSHIANMLRLLKLPEGVLTLLRAGDLSIGHARALIPFHDPLGLAEKILAEKMSVREVESYIKQGAKLESSSKPTAPVKDSDTRALEADLKANLGLPVVIKHSEGTEKGQMVISYKSLDDLDRLCAILSSNGRVASK